MEEFIIKLWDAHVADWGYLILFCWSILEGELGLIFAGIAGKNAKVSRDLWNLDEIYVEDCITPSGKDWNFNQHQKIDTTPKLEDFKKCVSEYLAWEVSNVLKNSAQDSSQDSSEDASNFH